MPSPSKAFPDRAGEGERCCVEAVCGGPSILFRRLLLAYQRTLVAFEVPRRVIAFRRPRSALGVPQQYACDCERQASHQPDGSKDRGHANALPVIRKRIEGETKYTPSPCSLRASDRNFRASGNSRRHERLSENRKIGREAAVIGRGRGGIFAIARTCSAADSQGTYRGLSKALPSAQRPPAVPGKACFSILIDLRCRVCCRRGGRPARGRPNRASGGQSYRVSGGQNFCSAP